MAEIGQYIFNEMVKLPEFFKNGYLIAFILWLAGIYAVGFFVGLFFNKK